MKEMNKKDVFESRLMHNKLQRMVYVCVPVCVPVCVCVCVFTSHCMSSI